MATNKITNLLTFLIQQVDSYATATREWRDLAKRDYEFVNGRQTSGDIKRRVEDSGRELLYFNEIRPQLELLAGHRSSQEVNYLASAVGREDKRLGEIALALMESTFEVGKANQSTRWVGDDGDTCGFGALEIGHTFDFATDIVWGDIFFERISPFALIFDAWGTAPQFQDGRFMGKRWWLGAKEFKAEYPKAAGLPTPDLWMSTMQSQHPDLSESLMREMADVENNHVAVYRLYYKEPLTLYFVADSETGDVYEGGRSKESAEKKLKDQLRVKAESLLGKVDVLPQGTEQGVVFGLVNAEGQPVLGPDQQPAVFDSQDDALAFVEQKTQMMMLEIGETWKVWSRKRSLVKWAEFTGFEVLDTGELPATTQKYPFRLYISRMIGDNVNDIEGIPRQIIDRQREITKRYNHLAAHLASSAHSGFFNRAGEGASTQQLQLMGSKPGIVVEYNTVMPTKIDPSQIPAGHFTLLQTNTDGIPRTTGINNELLGLTSSSTVSGEAIEKRQRGGITMQLGRTLNFQEFKKEVAEQTLYQIQVSMPTEKMRRTLGVWETKKQQQLGQASPFLDPVTAEPVREAELLDMLSTVKQTMFDLTLKAAPLDERTKSKQSTAALQGMQMVAQTGRAIGEETLGYWLEMSDLPANFVAALKADAQAAQQQALAQEQQESIQGAISGQQAREGPNA